MFNFKLTSYNPNATYPPIRFYVLNKGLNSGKPLLDPCPNCFVCICSCEEEKENLYWIFFALWQSHKFRHELIGSVIPFIRKKETINLVKAAALKNENRPEIFNKAVQVLKGINEKDLHFQDLARTLKLVKMALASDLV
jgi:hypothetical protein